MTVTDPRPDTLHELDAALRCTAVEQVTHDVKTFVLQPPDSGRLVFAPGQYLTVTVPVDGERLSRCYSITSPPTRPDTIAVTVKRVPGGPVSNWLHDEVRPGDWLDVSGPYGVFGSTAEPARKHLYLSAGSGITPLMCMTRTVADRRVPLDLVFVHHARTPADIVFRDELAQLSGRHPGIQAHAVCEADAPDEAWTGLRGRISREQLDRLVPDLVEREVFVCGPAPYLRLAQDLVLAAGVDPARVHEESYVLGGGGEAPRAAGAAEYSVEFRRTGRTIRCAADVPILDAASDAGLAHPSSCREGLCGTCKTTMLSGLVDMNHAGGIRPREIDAGQVLLCCSRPTTDVVLDA